MIERFFHRYQARIRINSRLIHTVTCLIVISVCLYSCHHGKSISITSKANAEKYTRLIESAARYETIDEIDSSLLEYQLALHLTDSCGIGQFKEFVLGQIGKLYLYRMGKVLKAEEFLIRQRDLLESGEGINPNSMIGNYIDLSFLYLKKLDLPYAESYGMMAYGMAKKHNIQDSILLSEIYTSIGNVKQKMLDSEAIHMFHQAESYFPFKGDSQHRIPNWVEGVINVYNNTPSQPGQVDSAMIWLERMHNACFSRIPDLAKYERLTSIYYFLKGNYKESIRHSRKSIKYFRSLRHPDPYSSIHAYIMQSAAYQYDHQYENALAEIDTALALKFSAHYTLNDLKSDIYSVSTFATKAEILGDQGVQTKDTTKIIEAFQIYDSISILLAYFVKFDTDGFLYNNLYNNFFYTKQVEYLAFLFNRTGNKKWLNKMHDVMTAYKAQAFIRDRALSSLYHSSIKNDIVFRNYIKNDQELETENYKSSTLVFEKKCIQAEKINLLLRHKEQLKDELLKKSPAVFAEIAQVQNIAADELLRITHDRKMAVLNYYIGDTYYNSHKIYALLAVDGEFIFKVIKSDSTLVSDIDYLFESERNFHQAFDLQSSDTFKTRNQKVYARLFSPIYNDLSGTKEVLIIPDGNLHHLSFEALMAGGPDQYFYLIDSVMISYAYSPNRLLDIGELNKTFNIDLLGMSFSSSETIRNRKLELLTELHGSYLELEAIKKSSTSENDKYFEGYDCTKANFFKYAPGARLIHLSTHGGFLKNIRNSGMLYLSKGEGVDKLNQYELHFSAIRPDLLVLSACDSGAGELNTEEGMMSIGRIFQACGTKKVISALWPISDRASTDLFTSFYRNYFHSQDAGTALRSAKLEMLHSSKFKFPGYWAGVVLYN